MPYIQGHIEHVIHQSDGYFVLAVKVHDTDFTVRDKVAKVSGYLCGLTVLRGGIPIRIDGEWISHPKWGRQMKPKGWHPWATTNSGRVRFLSECVDGFEDIDLTTHLVETFGEDVFDVLSDPPRCKSSLAESDIRHSQLETMLLHWRTARTLSDLSMFLQAYEMGPENVKDIYTRFGHDVIDIISNNPYRLTAVEGFPFERADRIAMHLGIPRDDPRRVEGAVLWLLRTQAQQGHLYVRRGELPVLLTELIQTEQIDPFKIEDLYGALQTAVTTLEERRIVTVDSNAGVYLPELYIYERGGGRKLADFLTPSELQVDLDSFLAEYQKGNQIELSEAQRDAVRKLVEHRVLVLTGLPGTGKTTVIRALVSVFKRSKMSFSLMAPTGIAAKRLASVTGEEAMTIHRTFGFNGSAWNYNGSHKFGVGAVIVDEMSMVDQELFYRVLDALHPSTMVVLVGDDAQLPSVGPGNVMRELLSCPHIPNVRLTQIFRQAATSAIVVASHKINRGKTPLLEVRNPESEFQFVQIADEGKIVDFIVEAAAKLKGRDANFQVLSPKYEGDVGVNILNERLRERLNPSGVQREWKLGKLFVREGDRLMVVKNTYSLNIYNGDMGKLMAIEREHLVVRIHGIGSGSFDSYVNIPKTSALTVLKLAYAITVHKSQGSEFDTILMPITRSQGRMLQRNLFYTAVTRARKKVWLLGDSMAVLRAIANDKVVQRNTVFGRIVSEAFERLRSEQPTIGVDSSHELSTGG
jgi:exodeoxyribonuclease V alpha subunit